MSWMAKLYDTYEQAMELDLPEGKRLMPISHTLQNAHINIRIDIKGNFIDARVLEKTQVVLPATEKSAGRSSGEAPHPLADKIQYVAADYKSYGGKKKGFFEGYRQKLQLWCDSEYSHKKALAVLHYVEKQSVIQDLINTKICFVDDNHQLLTSWPFEVTEKSPLPLLFKVLPKEKGILDQGNAMICWTVVANGDPVADTWKDESLQQSWIKYDTLASGKAEICYASGFNQPVATNHPAKLRHSGDKAKLVSANDTSGFTFRGRFIGGAQVANVGFETTQKAHNALRWLITNQGKRNGDQVIVAWAVSGNTIPAPLGSTLDLDNFEEAEDNGNDALSFKTDITKDIGNNFAKALGRYMDGYFDGRISQLIDSESIVIMGLDSATPGRMAVTYYREFMAREYIDAVTQWHLHLAWPQRVSRESTEGKKQKRTVHWFVGAPSPWNILQATYGDVVKSNETLKKNLHERITPCITENRPIPIDLVKLAVYRAGNRVGLEPWEWEQNLGVTCALYRGYRHPQRQPDPNQRRDYNMSLDLNNHSRDYLYGRLLAVAEKIEELALQVANVNRTTTAARLMQRFADRPYSTWRTIYGQLQPYIQQLQVNRRGFIENRKNDLDEIMALFDGNDFTDDKTLSGEYLLGFHCQRLALRKKQEDTTNAHATDTPEK